MKTFTRFFLFVAGILLVMPIAQAVPIGQWQTGNACPDTIPVSISVKTFGAIPDDMNDDTLAMQRAADFLCQCGSKVGSTLIYPPGRYDVSRHLTNPVTKADYLQSDAHRWSIPYLNCSNVSIIGQSATIEVAGNFTKEEDGVFTDTNVCAVPFAWASKYAFAPFWIENSKNVRLSGFTMNGHAKDTRIEAGFCYQEGRSHGIAIFNTDNFSISNVNIAEMTTDGIAIGSLARHGALNNVTVTNSARDNLTLTEARDIRVTNSRFLDAGKLGTQPDSYTSFSNRGVAFEPEVLPKDADWKRENDDLPAISPELSFLPGNFLFDHVTVSGNLGGQMSFAHRGTGANVTVINSTLRSPPQPRQTRPPTGVLEGGIAGLYVRNCTIDADKHMIYPSLAKRGSGVLLYKSPSFKAHLVNMAADASPLIKDVFRERKWFNSTRLINNTIRGGATLLHTEGVLPLLYVWGNTFTGNQTTSSVEESVYRSFGYLSVWMGPAYDEEPREWTDDVQFLGNGFFMPNSAPRLGAGKFQQGDIYFSGVNRFVDNQFTTDRAANAGTEKLTVSYDQLQLPTNVVDDGFPVSGSIYPFDYGTGFSIPLTSTSSLNIPPL